MYCFLKSLIVIRRYHDFAPRAANHCCQSLKTHSHDIPSSFWICLGEEFNESFRVVHTRGPITTVELGGDRRLLQFLGQDTPLAGVRENRY